MGLFLGVRGGVCGPHLLPMGRSPRRPQADETPAKPAFGFSEAEPGLRPVRQKMRGEGDGERVGCIL